MRCHLDHFFDGVWQTAVRLDIAEADRPKGRDGPIRLAFLTGYAIDHQGRPGAELIPGQTLELDPIHYDRWPEFLIDLLPQGVPRRFRWKGEASNAPDWHRVRATLAQWVAESDINQTFADFGERLRAIPTLLAEEGAEATVIDRVRPRSAALADAVTTTFGQGIQWD